MQICKEAIYNVNICGREDDCVLNISFLHRYIPSNIKSFTVKGINGVKFILEENDNLSSFYNIYTAKDINDECTLFKELSNWELFLEEYLPHLLRYDDQVTPFIQYFSDFRHILKSLNRFFVNNCITIPLKDCDLHKSFGNLTKNKRMGLYIDYAAIVFEADNQEPYVLRTALSNSNKRYTSLPKLIDDFTKSLDSTIPYVDVGNDVYKPIFKLNNDEVEKIDALLHENGDIDVTSDFGLIGYLFFENGILEFIENAIQHIKNDPLIMLMYNKWKAEYDFFKSE